MQHESIALTNPASEFPLVGACGPLSGHRQSGRHSGKSLGLAQKRLPALPADLLENVAWLALAGSALGLLAFSFA